MLSWYVCAIVPSDEVVVMPAHNDCIPAKQFNSSAAVLGETILYLDRINKWKPPHGIPAVLLWSRSLSESQLTQGWRE